MKNYVIKLLPKIIAAIAGLGCNFGCTSGDEAQEYRESQGNVSRFTVELADPVLRVTEFVRLEDGSVIRPKVYYYKTQRAIFKPRRVEESARVYRTLSPDLPDTHRCIYLPVSEDFIAYLLLIKKPLRAKEEQSNEGTVEYEWSDWQLLELLVEDLSSETAIRIPAFEELRKRELSEEQQKLLKELVAIYDEQAARGYKKAATPVPPRKYNPLIDFTVEGKENDDKAEDSKDDER